MILDSNIKQIIFIKKFIFSIKHSTKRKSVNIVTEEKMNHILNQTISEFILFMEKIKQDPVYETFFTNEKKKRK